ncbi:CsbD family protein [Legionella impletisoli]|uniref:CsbD family protein n=1 Tax=Legionella impletisoli TaxID=343510 RepID=A0A917JXL8_9GAMM|nr:CsbD family protein [Legionella impletisoli]GGI90129.1 CsbD family protein [Legionella impletisoli]
MNKDIFEGNWEQIKGELRQFWGKLTDDDLQQIKGNQEELLGKLQKHYGYTKEEAKKAVNDFMNSR